MWPNLRSSTGTTNQMLAISLARLLPTDTALIKLIAHWYLMEWSIPSKDTFEGLSRLPAQGIPFQVVISVGGKPVATGGLYNNVNLHKVEPRFKAFGPWLSVIYTAKGHRQKGIGTQLCKKVVEMAKALGVKEIYLYSHTAESMYKKLGWVEMERVQYKGKDTTVMRKEL
jgi:GNAT superfamily N-acetyltransferase